MLEIPESRTLADQLDKTVKGQLVRRVTAGAAPHKFAFFTGDPAAYGALLAGRRIDAAYPRGGQVELALEDMRLVLADGVNLRYLAPDEPRPDKHQLLLELENDAALAATVQMYGGLWAFPAGTNDNFYYTVGGEKPSPLSAAFDRAYFDTLLDSVKPEMRLKAVLATEQRIPGLGNGVLQDILFAARLHPKTRLSALTEEDRERLFDAVKETLFAMTLGGGRDTERDLFGCPGGYATRLSSRTWKSPCPECGGVIERQAFLGGNVYVCPRCQPLKD